jgi:hypothetical protein
MEGDVSQLPGLIKEWMATEEELNVLGAEIREKRKRIKLVRQMITTIMKKKQIGCLNISAGAVMARSKQTKAPLTKKFLMSTLTEFFNGDAAKATACAAFLEEHRPLKTVDSIRLEPKS